MLNLQLRNLPRPLKLLLGSFLFALLFGYGASFMVLSNTTDLSADGIEESYNGNEEDEDASILKFKKSSFEILTTVHSHVFTLGAIFLITGLLTWFTPFGANVKTFFMIEPMISLVVSFTSIILMWRGFVMFKYLAYISGILMHSIFLLSIGLILIELLRKQQQSIS